MWVPPHVCSPLVSSGHTLVNGGHRESVLPTSGLAGWRVSGSGRRQPPPRPAQRPASNTRRPRNGRDGTVHPVAPVPAHLASAPSTPTRIHGEPPDPRSARRPGGGAER